MFYKVVVTVWNIKLKKRGGRGPYFFFLSLNAERGPGGEAGGASHKEKK